jgi:hypothetical protein
MSKRNVAPAKSGAAEVRPKRSATTAAVILSGRVTAQGTIGSVATLAETLGCEVLSATRGAAAVTLDVRVPESSLGKLNDAQAVQNLEFRSTALEQAFDRIWRRSAASLSVPPWNHGRWKPHPTIRGELRRIRRDREVAFSRCKVLQQHDAGKEEAYFEVAIPAGDGAILNLNHFASEHALGNLIFKPARPRSIDVDLTPEQGAAAFREAQRVLLLRPSSKAAELLGVIDTRGYGLLVALMVVHFNRCAQKHATTKARCK